ncbi:MAG: hypothetical protein ND895_20205 [Pyrinomonadaceae bacterium]|nr:hypothetical protein [Pyrinomonadaceae bacterium]
MKNFHEVTYSLAVILVLPLTFLVAKTRSNGVFIATAQTQTAMQRYLEAQRTFPIVDYDEAEPSDPVKRAAAREKQIRRNTRREVMITPHPQDAEISLQEEGGDDLAALPSEKSDLIMVGSVVSAAAHLSGNKMNVVSEFAVLVEKVHKSFAPTAPSAGSSVTVERFGGYVRYPNGQTVLYRWAGTSMPKVGGRYIFFLQSIPQSDDYTILEFANALDSREGNAWQKLKF